MDADELYRDALGRFREDSEKLEREQKEQRQAAEIELLDSATTMKEYNERRNAIPHLVLRPDVPPDEMNMTDYMKLRERKVYSWTHANYIQALKNAKRATEG